jgi:Uma2 family endonuclease
MIQRLIQPQQLGPGDRGRSMTYEEFMAGDYQEGYRYELIDGALFVSPAPNPPHALIFRWIWSALDQYTIQKPKIANFLAAPRIFVPTRQRTTAPEPDIAVYRDFPTGPQRAPVRWQDYSPLLVVEVLSPDNADKDLVRNVELYFEVPSIKEYWLFDTRDDENYPTLVVHRRHGSKWRIITVAPGEKYTTRLLPGFELVNDRFQ